MFKALRLRPSIMFINEVSNWWIGFWWRYQYYYSSFLVLESSGRFWTILDDFVIFNVKKDRGIRKFSKNPLQRVENIYLKWLEVWRMLEELLPFACDWLKIPTLLPVKRIFKPSESPGLRMVNFVRMLSDGAEAAAGTVKCGDDYKLKKRKTHFNIPPHPFGSKSSSGCALIQVVALRSLFGPRTYLR